MKKEKNLRKKRYVHEDLLLGPTSLDSIIIEEGPWKKEIIIEEDPPESWRKTQDISGKL